MSHDFLVSQVMVGHETENEVRLLVCAAVDEMAAQSQRPVKTRESHAYQYCSVPLHFLTFQA